MIHCYVQSNVRDTPIWSDSRMHFRGGRKLNWISIKIDKIALKNWNTKRIHFRRIRSIFGSARMIVHFMTPADASQASKIGTCVYAVLCACIPKIAAHIRIDRTIETSENIKKKNLTFHPIWLGILYHYINKKYKIHCMNNNNKWHDEVIYK